jgi:hypothetical protein
MGKLVIFKFNAVVGGGGVKLRVSV